MRDCKGAECMQIYRSAGTLEEQKRLGEIMNRQAGADKGKELFELAKKVSDGDSLHKENYAIFLHYRAAGRGALRDLPKTTLGEAKKDPHRARGSVVEVRGLVLDIKKEVGGWKGRISAENMQSVEFMTPFDTDGIVEGKQAKFTGMFTQVLGAESAPGVFRSVVLIGTF